MAQAKLTAFNIPNTPVTPEELIEKGRAAVKDAGRSLLIWHIVYAAAGFAILWLYLRLKIQTGIFVAGCGVGVMAGIIIMLNPGLVRAVYGAYLFFGAFAMIGALVWGVIWQGFGALDDNVKVTVGSLSWMLSVACNVVFLVFKLILAGLFVSAFVKDRLVDYVNLYESREVSLYLKKRRGELL